MSFFWNYFRFQSFFGVLFPFNLSLDTPTTPFSPYILFLLFLAAISTVVLVRSTWGSASKSPISPQIVASATAMCELGTLGGIFLQDNPVWAILSIPSAAFVAFGFCGQYIAWTERCTRSFSAECIVVMAGSYCLSVIVLVAVALISSAASTVIVILTPLISGITWLLSDTFGTSATDPVVQPTRHIPPYVALFLAFLACGAVIRGIVDVANVSSSSLGIRWPLSIALSLLLPLSWGIYSARMAKHPDARHPMDLMAENYVLAWWVCMAMLFFVGVTWGLAVGSFDDAGQLVVVARSMLDFVMIVLLCNVASHWNGRPADLFVLFGLGTQLLSWLLSYAAVPLALAADISGHRPVQDTLVLGALLVLLLTLVCAFATFWMGGTSRARISLAPMVQNENPASPLQEQDSRSDAANTGSDFSIIAQAYRLTPRETEIAYLFSRGYSVKHIAETLVISMGTAQSHLKGAYRKLDIHSRDELLELIHRDSRL